MIASQHGVDGVDALRLFVCLTTVKPVVQDAKYAQGFMATKYISTNFQVDILKA